MESLLLLISVVNLIVCLLLLLNGRKPSINLGKFLPKREAELTPKSKVYISKVPTVAEVNDRKRFEALNPIDQEIELSYREKYENNQR